jgi:hypothetical protein
MCLRPSIGFDNIWPTAIQQAFRRAGQALVEFCILPGKRLNRISIAILGVDKHTPKPMVPGTFML